MWMKNGNNKEWKYASLDWMWSTEPNEGWEGKCSIKILFQLPFKIMSPGQ